MTKEVSLEHLNQDLADELAAINQYTVYSAKVYGPYRPQLSAWDMSADESTHAAETARILQDWPL